MKNRAYLYGLVLILGTTFSLLLPGWFTSPSGNMNNLIQLSQNNPTQATFKGRASYLTFLPKSYVVVLYSGNESDFSPAEYIVISKLKDELTVELIEGAGVSGVQVLKDDKARDYLVSHDISLDELNIELRRRN